MSVWATAMVAANSAVITPTHAMRVGSHGDATCRSGLMRTIRNTPAVTIVAAWINADTGVGPSIASGSQKYSGSWALFPVAPRNSRAAMPVAADLVIDPVSALWLITE